VFSFAETYTAHSKIRKFIKLKLKTVLFMQVMLIISNPPFCTRVSYLIFS
jgi:hypothetical protein